MKTVFLKFVIRCFMLTVLLELFAGLFIYYLSPDFVTPTLPILPVFFFAATILVHYILLRAVEKRFGKFMNVFLLSTFLKLVFYMMVLIIYSFINRADAVPFIISFFVCYLLYTFYEIFSLASVKKTEG
jgi:hypothetical protein